MGSSDLVTLRRYHIAKQTEKGICIHLDFKFNTTLEGGASVWLPKSLFQHGALPRWLVEEKEREIAAENGFKSCEILIDEAETKEAGSFANEDE